MNDLKTLRPALAVIAALALQSGLIIAAPAVAAESAPSAAPAPDVGSANPRAQMREAMRERMAERHGNVDRHLSTDQVRDIVQGRLAMSGNPNLKVGKVTAKDEHTVAVDIVTKTGALVETRDISTRTGRPAAMERAIADRSGAGAGRTGRPGTRDPEMRRPGRDGRAGGAPNPGPAQTARRDLNLSVDQAKKLAEARLILMGNPHLKVGAVKEKDADTISIDIVAADNSLVVQREIDRHSGRPKRNRA